MIEVKRLLGDDRRYCTHCDDRAVCTLYFCNPKIVQQSSCGSLCQKCAKKLIVEFIKAMEKTPSILPKNLKLKTRKKNVNQRRSSTNI
jgi:hypothetical protein